MLSKNTVIISNGNCMELKDVLLQVVNSGWILTWSGKILTSALQEILGFAKKKWLCDKFTDSPFDKYCNQICDYSLVSV